ncbi:transposase [Sporomusa sp. KB1]|uniref:transposase n=1 Tax=Sporomusa sp. KB1 TaxID=943346 RepID=UPI001C938987
MEFTTDLYKTARQILQVYEIRPEIEEDFRQLKDFWKLKDFKSTKFNYITFYIVMTLLGYLYFQVFKNIDEG